MGWAFPWASSLDSDFNYDFDMSVREEEQRSGEVEYTFRAVDVTPVLESGGEGPVAEMAARCGTDARRIRARRPA